MRSGVGPATELTRLGIPIVAAVEGVGANLQNHPVLYLATHLEKHARQSPALRPQFLSCLRFSSGADEALRADMIMLIMNKSSWHGLGQAVAGLGVGLYRPFSRGSVRLASTDPHTPPVIDFRMLTDPRDHARMVTGLRLALDLMQDEAVRPLRHELFAAGYSKTVRRLNRPGITNIVVTKLLAAMMDGPDSIRRFMIRRISPADPSERAMSEAPWLEQTVTRHTFGMYHPAGTCRMGRPEDATTVVDPACTVQGTEALSVVDASIMPTLIRGNTNIPVIMLAERAADLLRTAPL
jgi:5-(hydroxymethyl)furfural/furfural oxidase